MWHGHGSPTWTLILPGASATASDFAFGLHGAGWNHDPLPSSCGPDHLGMCGIVIVYRISPQLSRRDSGVFCWSRLSIPSLTTMLARPSPNKRGVHGAGYRRGLQRGKASDERLRHEQSQTDAARSNQQETANSTVTILKHGD